MSTSQITAPAALNYRVIAVLNLLQQMVNTICEHETQQRGVEFTPGDLMNEIRHERAARPQARTEQRRGGTPTAQLCAMSDAELKAQHRAVVAAQAAPNYVPKRLRAAPSNADKHAHSILKSERARIERIARERQLDLEEKQTSAYVHAAYTAPLSAAEGRDPYGEPQRGDTVDAEFRDPDTGAIVRERGSVENITSGKFGVIYHTRVGGKLYPLEKRGIKKIILNS